MQVMCNVLGI